MDDYDIYLRHAAVRNGEWVGFALAWKGLAGAQGLSARPHLQWRPWVLDPNFPNDPTLGSWGVRQWRFDIALFDRLTGLMSVPPEDGRTAADMRTDLLAFLDLPALDLQDAGGARYTARLTAFREEVVEPYGSTHTGGDSVAHIELAEVEV